MKLKSFGLVEAIIATAILLLLVTGIFYLTVKSSERLANFLHEETARSYADDFFDRVNILNKSGYLDFKSAQTGDKLNVNCLDSSKSSECLSKTNAAFVKEFYPYGSLAESSKDEYKKIANSDTKASGGYKIKSTVTKDSPKSWKIELDIIWKQNGMQENYNLQRIINE